MNILKKVFQAITLTVMVTILTPAQTQDELYQEYMELNQSLQQIQQQALSDKDIRAMNEKFSNKVETAMLKENPELEPEIIKRNELIEQFEKESENASPEKLEEIKSEYDNVAQKLQPVQEEIMQKEEFQAEVQKIEGAVIDKMEEINPETPKMLERMNELVAQLQGQSQ